MSEPKILELEKKILELEKKIDNREKVLYTNESGTAANFTLSESKDNFDYIEVIYKNNDNFQHSAKMKVLSGTQKMLLFTLNSNGNDRIYQKFAGIQFEGTTVKFNADNLSTNAGASYVANREVPSPSAGNIILVLEVIGIKNIN